MANLTGPLFSLEAVGTFGKKLTYGWTKGTQWLRSWVKKKYTRTLGQDTVRNLFKEGITKWNEMFKKGWGQYNELGVDDNQLWELASQGKERGGRCQYMSEYLKHQGQKWQYYPLPPQLDRILATDDIVDYNQTITDLETLTGLSMCWTPTALGIIHPALPIAGASLMPGLIFILNWEDFDQDGYYRKKWYVAHELTHCLLMQHGYYQFFFVHTDHETMANECADRIVAGVLSPVYTYKGKTMSELVPFLNCP